MTQNAWDTDFPNANGEILIGSGSGRALAANITGDANISITNGSNSITVDNNASAGSGGLVLISTATASTSSSINFTGLSSTYIAYLIYFLNVAPASDAVTFCMRTSTDNGSSYDSGASDYSYNAVSTTAGGRNLTVNLNNSYMLIAGPASSPWELGNASNEKLNGYLVLYNPSATTYTQAQGQCVYYSEGAVSVHTNLVNMRKSAADVDAITFFMDSGNISSGDFILYGFTAS